MFPPSQMEKEAQEAADYLDPKGERKESLVDVPRQGARRKCVKIGSAWDPILTKRQREVLKGKVKLSPSMGRLWAMARGEGTEMTMAEFVEGLSVEELVRGRLKDRNGRFTGHPPQWVPAEFHRACIRELMGRGKHLWQENYIEAVKAMTEIATGQVPATPSERLKAAQFVIERIEGKVPDVVNVISDKRWAVLLDGIVAEVDDHAVERGRKAIEGSGIVDGEVVEEWEEEDDQPVRPPRRAVVRRTNARKG